MLEWTVQRDGGVTVLGCVKERTGCGTQCRGQVDKVVFAHRMDPKISKACSN